MGLKVVEIQLTPNPHALKFVLDRTVWREPLSFFNADAARAHPLAEKLFAVPGVSSLLLLGDFVTINKRPDADWVAIKRIVRKVLAEHSIEPKTESM